MDDERLTIEHVLEACERLRRNKPCGLPDNYICVIHPRHRRWLEQLNEKTSYNNFMGTLNGISIYEENRAPQDRFEFMDIMTYYSKYPPIIPKQYSKLYILWDNVNTTIRRWCIQLKRMYK